jgi:2-(acetamidomethylene)succinate hydrolase
MTTTTFEWKGFAVEERMVPVPGGEIAVNLLGSGPALVLLHGITSAGIAWTTVADQLAADFQLIIVDQRGHGRSFKPDHGYLLPDYADDLDALLSHFKLDHPLIMGHSMGGMVTLEWATRHPNRAAALVLEDAPMRHGGPNAAEHFDGWIVANAMPTLAAEAYYRNKYPGMPDVELRIRADSITATARAVFTELKENMLSQRGAVIIDQFAGITSPTLLVYGDLHDGGMVPRTDAAHFEETLANAETVRIAGVGHGIHRDVPDQFLSVVTPFLKRHAADASWIGGGSDQD